MRQSTMLQAAIVMMLLTAAGNARTVDLNFTGKVVSSPCVVDTASISREVKFESMVKGLLSDPGSSGDWKTFEIRLINCPATVKTATATFSGTPDVDDATLYANSGTAKSVAVQMVTEADKNLVKGPGSTMMVIPDVSRNAVFNMAARLYTVKGGVTGGTFVSTAQINFTYQ